MLVDFLLVLEKVIEYNKNLDKCIKDYPEEEDAFNSMKMSTEKMENPFKIDECDEIGFCFTHSLNFNYPIGELTHYKIKEQFYSFQPSTLEGMRSWNKNKKMRNNYGVCDDYKQVLKEYPELKKDKNRKFIVSMTPMFKDCQPKSGGWRWHKWGKYIGKQKPTCEYLYDEKDIELVFVYHIYEVELDIIVEEKVELCVQPDFNIHNK
jgi:hypothetical protein